MDKLALVHFWCLLHKESEMTVAKIRSKKRLNIVLCMDQQQPQHQMQSRITGELTKADYGTA